MERVKMEIAIASWFKRLLPLLVVPQSLFPGFERPDEASSDKMNGIGESFLQCSLNSHQQH